MIRNATAWATVGIMATALMAGSPATAPAELDPAAARETLKQFGDAVITLEVTVNFKYNMGGQQQDDERKSEAIGTLIDPSGLLVTSLSAVDPSKRIAMYYGDEESVTTTIKSVRYIMADGTEMDAALVLRDPDLDLVFLRPLAKPEKPLPAVPLTNTAAAEVYDEIYSIERAGRIARRSVLGKRGNVVGIITKPRTIYLPSVGVVTRNLGCPVFTESGQLLGLTTFYHFPGGKNALGDNDEPSVAVILPAADVADVARQAPESSDPSAGETK